MRGLVGEDGDICLNWAPLKNGCSVKVNKQYVYVCLSPCQLVQAEKWKRGCDLAKRQLLWNGLHFNWKWPCQGQHMSACLPGLLETQGYWTKAAAPQRHTQQLFSVATYHLMTLEEGKTTCDLGNSSPKVSNSHRQQQLNASNNTDFCQKESFRYVWVWFLDAPSYFFLLLNATNKQIR